jgi:hypothetical protein
MYINRFLRWLSDKLLNEKISDYKTVRESEKWWILLAVVIPLLLFIICLTFVVIDKEILGDEFLIGVVYFIVALSAFLYCQSFKIIQNRYIKKGKKYTGQIIKAEEFFSANRENTYCIFIEFFVDGKRLVRKTGRYIGNPNYYLASKNCSVYELNNKYIEADFKLRDRKNYNEQLIKIYKHRLFVQKDEYV